MPHQSKAQHTQVSTHHNPCHGETCPGCKPYSTRALRRGVWLCQDASSEINLALSFVIHRSLVTNQGGGVEKRTVLIRPCLHWQWLNISVYHWVRWSAFRKRSAVSSVSMMTRMLLGHSPWISTVNSLFHMHRLSWQSQTSSIKAISSSRVMRVAQ